MRNAETVETLRNLGDGLNACCIVRWTCAFEGQSGMLWCESEMSPKAHVFNTGLLAAGLWEVIGS